MFRWKIFYRKKRRKVSKKSQEHFLLHKDKAFDLVSRLFEENNSIYNFSFNNVVIRNQHTRWGSCSSKGNLNFNYKIVFLPEHLARYIVIHELCHLKEFNHSDRFWKLVSLAFPEYKTAREELRLISPLLSHQIKESQLQQNKRVV